MNNMSRLQNESCGAGDVAALRTALGTLLNYWNNL